MEKTALFDQAAAQYDANFTHSNIGERQRKRVYHWLEVSGAFNKMEHVFELNCGTGYDAEKFHQAGKTVIATDASAAMVQYARNHRDKAIEFKQLDFNNPDTIQLSGDTVFSNFGGLNCVDSDTLSSIIKTISQQQKKGDQLITVIMPRFCMMEGLYFFFKFQWRKLFRRNTMESLAVHVDGISVPTWYHSPKAVMRLLSDYQIKLKKPVAFFLPPSYLEPFFSRHARMLNLLNSLEKRVGRFSFLSGWSDHYILIAEKK